MPTISKITIGNTSYDLKDAKAAPATHEHSADAITSGILSVANGGTGQSSHTANAVLTGNGTNAVNNVETASGALYATTANGAAQFGILPIALGGTDATTAADAVRNIVNGRDIEPQRINATSHITTNNGQIYTQAGNIYTANGSVSANNGNIYTTNGNIFTQGGDIIAQSADGLTDLHKLSEKANTNHTHSASNIISGTLPITRGGTGQGGIQSSTKRDDIVAVPANSGVTVNSVSFYK